MHAINDFKTELSKSELGKQSAYDMQYCPEKLCPIARSLARSELGILENALPFAGVDMWTNYEVSWLNQNGKPIVVIAELTYPCNSPNIIESKSLKLYFNSLSNTKFQNEEIFYQTVKNDLEKNIGAPIILKLIHLQNANVSSICNEFSGTCIDDLDTECNIYTVNPDFLLVENIETNEILTSNLLKSNCPITKQPDIGSVQISYSGKKINRESLLKYLVSFRNHHAFHEQCIEKIFLDIMQKCKPNALAVYGRYLRRGGLDVNPYRCTDGYATISGNIRLCRQ